MDTNDKKRDLTPELSSDHYVHTMDHVCVRTHQPEQRQEGEVVFY